MPREHNPAIPAIPADTSALLDQIERARHELMLTINMPQRSIEAAIIANIINQDIHLLMDRLIDEAHGVSP